MGFDALEAEEFNFRSELDAIRLPHLSVHMSDNRGNVIGRGSSVINDKISVNGRNFRTANRKTL